MIGKVGFMKNESLINSKVAVIDEKGIVHVMGRVNESKYHIKYLLDYLDNNYFNKNNLTIGSSRDKYGNFYGTLGNIIYFNDVETGMMYLPDELTSEQIDALYKIDLGNQRIALFYNPMDFGTFKLFNSIGLDEQSTFKEVLNEYFGGEKNKSQIK